MNQNQTGWVLIVTAFALLAFNMSDAVADLKEWHGASTPQFLAILLKQAGSVTIAALGGKMTNPFRGEQR